MRRCGAQWPRPSFMKMHVGGFTRYASSGSKQAGTYSAIIEKIPYLKSLGVTAVELLPVFGFDSRQELRRGADGQALMNYWGYSTISYFAPESSYCVSPESGGRFLWPSGPDQGIGRAKSRRFQRTGSLQRIHRAARFGLARPYRSDARPARCGCAHRPARSRRPPGLSTGRRSRLFGNGRRHPRKDDCESAGIARGRARGEAVNLPINPGRVVFTF